jgi:hypothetical protein
MCVVSRALSRGVVDTPVDYVGSHLDVDVCAGFTRLAFHLDYSSLLFVLLSVVSQVGPVQHFENVQHFSSISSLYVRARVTVTVPRAQKKKTQVRLLPPAHSTQLALLSPICT